MFWFLHGQNRDHHVFKKQYTLKVHIFSFALADNVPNGNWWYMLYVILKLKDIKVDMFTNKT